MRSEKPFEKRAREYEKFLKMWLMWEKILLWQWIENHMKENHESLKSDEELRDRRIVLGLAVDQHLVLVVASLQNLVEQSHVADVF